MRNNSKETRIVVRVQKYVCLPWWHWRRKQKRKRLYKVKQHG
jgi:hypothetical protein